VPDVNNPSLDEAAADQTRAAFQAFHDAMGAANAKEDELGDLINADLALKPSDRTRQNADG